MRERGLVVAILLLSSVFFVVASLPGVSAKTLYVGGSGPANYTTIQRAIDMADRYGGDTVFVFTGTYYENVIIRKSVALIGEDRETTIIDGGEKTNVISIARSQVTVSGFTIRNSGSGYEKNAGIRVEGTANITNNIVVDNYYGIVVDGYGGLIDGNVIRRNLIGLFMEPNGITVSNNLIVDNGQGIEAFFFDNSVLANNTIVYNLGSVMLWKPAWGSRIYHNNILKNEIFPCDDSEHNLWDNGYPSGGNYWGHHCVDQMSGPEQNIPGSDGICDSWVWVPICWSPPEVPEPDDPPDRYPLVHPLRQLLLPPDEPRRLQVTPGDEEATLKWDEPDFDGGSPVTGYSIFRGTSKYQETFLTEIGNVTTYTDTGLVNGRRYYYRVSARNAIGEGPRSNSVGVEPVELPAPPVDPTATAEDRRVVLNWEHPTDDGGSPITGYRIYRGMLPGEEELLVRLSTLNHYVDDGRVNGVTYYYQLTSVNRVGEGPKSKEVSATPSTTPSAPQNLRATARRVVKLEWGPPVDDGASPVTEYMVFRRADASRENLLVWNGMALNCTDRNVELGQTYHYYVRAVNANGLGPESNEAIVTPIPDPSASPGLPITCGIENITHYPLPPVIEDVVGESTVSIPPEIPPDPEKPPIRLPIYIPKWGVK